MTEMAVAKAPEVKDVGRRLESLLLRKLGRSPAGFKNRLLGGWRNGPPSKHRPGDLPQHPRPGVAAAGTGVPPSSPGDWGRGGHAAFSFIPFSLWS